LAICAMNLAGQNSLDFFAQMIYPTLDGS
jgi:hypothetical protein